MPSDGIIFLICPLLLYINHSFWHTLNSDLRFLKQVALVLHFTSACAACQLVEERRPFLKNKQRSGAWARFCSRKHILTHKVLAVQRCASETEHGALHVQASCAILLLPCARYVSISAASGPVS